MSVLSVLVGGFAYTYMVISTINGTGDGCSLTTFVLWGALAFISAIEMKKRAVYAGVPMLYGTGATATAIVLLFKGKFAFTMLDAVITSSVVSCVILWNTRAAKWVLVLSVAAAALAAVPFITMTWNDPASSPIVPNASFLITNALSFASAKKWTLEDRLYSGVNVVVCSLLVIPWILNYFHIMF